MLSRRNVSKLMLAAVVAVPTAGAAQTIYVGPAAGNWNDPANWSASVPVSAIDAIVDNRPGVNAVVTLQASTTGSVKTLSIAAGDTVALGNSSTLNINENLSVNGTLRFDPGANNVLLHFSAAATTISGTGAVDFNYLGGAGVGYFDFTPGTITNSGVVRGSGTMQNIHFTNAIGGIVENYQTIGQLYLDSYNGGAGQFRNLGKVRALAGSLVTFAGDSGGDFDSTDGSIQANGAGAVVRLINGAAITGGNFSTTVGGEIVVEAGHTGSLSSAQSLTGTLRIRNSATLYMTGTPTNNGVIRFSPNGSAAVLTLTAPLTLNGTGSLIGEYTGTGPGGRIDGADNRLTLGSGQTASGVIHFSNIRVTNNGLIDADNAAVAGAGAGIYLDPYNGGAADQFVNNATIRSSGGGLLQLVGDAGGNFDSRAGTISAIGDGSITEFMNGASIRGGTYTNTGTGRIRVRPGHTGNITDDATIAAGSTFVVPSSSQLNLSGTMTVLGALSIESGVSTATLKMSGATTLQGSGTTRFNSTPGGGEAVLSFGEVLTIAAGHAVRGDAFFQNVRVINNGSLIGDESAAPKGGMYLDPFNGGGQQFTNNGTIQAVANNFVSLVGDAGGEFSGPGTYRADGANAFLHLANSVVVNGGNFTTTTGGIVRVPTGHGGTVVGSTITVGSRFNVDPNATLIVSGTLTNNGTLEVLSSAAGSGRLQNTVPVTLTGPGVTRFTSGAGVRSTIPSGALMTIATGHTVYGSPYFQNTLTINNGTILADEAAMDAYIDPYNGVGQQFTNNGTIRAAAGATASLAGDAGGQFTGAGSYVADGANAFVNLINSIGVVGGTFSTANGGVIRVPSGQSGQQSLDGSTVAAGARFDVEPGGNLVLINTVTNNGTMNIQSGEAGIAQLNTNLVPATLQGTGVTRFTSTPAVRSRMSFGQVLTIAGGHTIAGSPYFQNTSTINNGTIVADQATMNAYLDPYNGVGQQFTNNGTIRATAGGTMTLAGDNGGTFSGPGVFIADAGSVIESFNSLGGDAGPVSGAGTFRANTSANAGFLNFRVANLAATGSGTARITAGGGNAGTSKVNTVTIDNNGRVDVTDHGLIVDYTGASPATTLRGYLASGRNGGTWNGSGIMSSLASDSFHAVGYAEASLLFGAPSSFLGQSIDGTSIVMRYTFDGDANLDGAVNFADLVLLAQNYNNTVNPSWLKADFNYDGSTGFADLVVLAQNYNKSLPASVVSVETLVALGGESFAADWALAQSLVPEPTSVFAALGMMAASASRRRKGVES